MIRDDIGNVLRARAAATPDRVCCAMDKHVDTSPRWTTGPTCSRPAWRARRRNR